MFPLVRAITPAKDAPAGSHADSRSSRRPRAAGGRRTWRRSRIPRSWPPNLRRVTWPARSRSQWPPRCLRHHPRSRTQRPRRIHPTADQGPKPETRVAAIGDSDFAANAYLGIEGNRDLFMNTVNWLSQQEGLIAIRPREAADRRITLTANTISRHVLDLDRLHSGDRPRGRRLLLVAEALACAVGPHSLSSSSSRDWSATSTSSIRNASLAGQRSRRSRSARCRPTTSRKCRSRALTERRRASRRPTASGRSSSR